MNLRSRNLGTCRRAALTLVEVTFATMLVGFVLVGAMDLLGSVVSGRTSTTNAIRAEAIAQQLMAEILNGKYQDDTSPVFGVEAGETLGLRSGYDDVDDYNSWSATSLLGLDGIVLANTTDWKREVTVEYVDPANPATVSVTDQGVKRITVTVKYNNIVITRLVALRTNKY